MTFNRIQCLSCYFGQWNSENYCTDDESMYLLKYMILKRLFFNFDGCRNGLHGTSDTNSMYKGLFFVKKIRNLNKEVSVIWYTYVKSHDIFWWDTYVKSHDIVRAKSKLISE